MDQSGFKCVLKKALAKLPLKRKQEKEGIMGKTDMFLQTQPFALIRRTIIF